MRGPLIHPGAVPPVHRRVLGDERAWGQAAGSRGRVSVRRIAAILLMGPALDAGYRATSPVQPACPGHDRHII